MSMGQDCFGWPSTKTHAPVVPLITSNPRLFLSVSLGSLDSRLGSISKPHHCFVIFSIEAFVFGVYFYTMRAVGGTDELQVAIDKFEEQEKLEAKPNMGSKA
ncbi:hypothetical protein V6N13_083396 [Hibiscus sabdariffa]